jgi:hypothetical protein
MSEPRVSFSPKLATVVRDADRPIEAQPLPNTKRRVVLVRIGALALLIIALGTALHFGTASHRDALRKARIQEALATSGLESDVPKDGTTGSGIHD